jgi:hypothetical protein
MITALWAHYQSEIRLRWRELATGTELWIAIACGVAIFAWGDRAGIGDAHVSDVVTAILAYAAVAFGFCLTGLTVAMTLPDASFTRLLATAELPKPAPTATGVARWCSGSRGRRYARMMKRRVRGKQEPPNAYSDLLFVFSWTAMVHWAAIACSFALIVSRGSSPAFIPDSASGWTKAAAGVLAFVVVYAALQFLITLVTLSGVGSTYIAVLRRAGTQKESPADTD